MLVLGADVRTIASAPLRVIDLQVGAGANARKHKRSHASGRGTHISSGGVDAGGDGADGVGVRRQQRARAGVQQPELHTACAAAECVLVYLNQYEPMCDLHAT
jgi:hypothetical protein